MSSLLLLDEKEKLIVLGRRAELFYSAQELQKKYMRNQGKNYFAKKWGSKFAAISGSNIKLSLYSVTATFG